MHLDSLEEIVRRPKKPLFGVEVRSAARHDHPIQRDDDGADWDHDELAEDLCAWTGCEARVVALVEDPSGGAADRRADAVRHRPSQFRAAVRSRDANKSARTTQERASAALLRYRPDEDCRRGNRDDNTAH